MFHSEAKLLQKRLVHRRTWTLRKQLLHQSTCFMLYCTLCKYLVHRSTRSLPVAMLNLGLTDQCHDCQLACAPSRWPLAIVHPNETQGPFGLGSVWAQAHLGTGPIGPCSFGPKLDWASFERNLSMSHAPMMAWRLGPMAPSGLWLDSKAHGLLG